MDRPPDWTVVDASNHILGRLASNIAKRLLLGQRMAVVNAEHVMVSGNRPNLLAEMERRLEISSVIHPKHGPFHPRRPDTIFKRVVRGMLPWRKAKGMDALRRLRVYIGVPPQYKEAPKTVFQEAMLRREPSYYQDLGELAKRIGWKGVTSYHG